MAETVNSSESGSPVRKRSLETVDGYFVEATSDLPDVLVAHPCKQVSYLSGLFPSLLTTFHN
jgi:hypothetical protein